MRANKISEISSKIGTLYQLKVLKLDKNELLRLPDEVFDISGLKELTI